MKMLNLCILQTRFIEVKFGSIIQGRITKGTEENFCRRPTNC